MRPASGGAMEGSGGECRPSERINEGKREGKASLDCGRETVAEWIFQGMAGEVARGGGMAHMLEASARRFGGGGTSRATHGGSEAKPRRGTSGGGPKRR